MTAYGPTRTPRATDAFGLTTAVGCASITLRTKWDGTTCRRQKAKGSVSSPTVREGVDENERRKDEGGRMKAMPISSYFILHPSAFILPPCFYALPDGRATASSGG